MLSAVSNFLIHVRFSVLAMVGASVFAYAVFFQNWKLTMRPEPEWIIGIVAIILLIIALVMWYLEQNLNLRFLKLKYGMADARRKGNTQKEDEIENKASIELDKLLPLLKEAVSGGSKQTQKQTMTLKAVPKEEAKAYKSVDVVTANLKPELRSDPVFAVVKNNLKDKPDLIYQYFLSDSEETKCECDLLVARLCKSSVPVEGLRNRIRFWLAPEGLIFGESAILDRDDDNLVNAWMRAEPSWRFMYRLTKGSGVEALRSYVNTLANMPGVVKEYLPLKLRPNL